MRQTNGSGSDLLASYGSYTSLHQPQNVTDAAGQTTAFTYNAAGQVLTVTNAKNETTTYAYDPNGGLQSVAGPMAGLRGTGGGRRDRDPTRVHSR